MLSLDQVAFDWVGTTLNSSLSFSGRNPVGNKSLLSFETLDNRRRRQKIGDEAVSRPVLYV